MSKERVLMVKGCSACRKDHPIKVREIYPREIRGQKYGEGGICTSTGKMVYVSEEGNESR